MRSLAVLLLGVLITTSVAAQQPPMPQFVPRLPERQPTNDVLWEQGSVVVYRDTQDRMICTGCRFARPAGPFGVAVDQGPVVIVPQAPGRVSVAGVLGDIIVYKEDAGTSCRAEDWHVVDISRRSSRSLDLASCVEVKSYQLSLQSDRKIVLTITHTDRKVTRLVVGEQ